MLLRLLLRQLDLLRGSEAATITDYLEQAAFVDELAGRLAHGRPWQRAAAADELGRTRSAHAVPPLAAALSDDADDVRVVAARSLALIGRPEAVDALAHALISPTRWALALMSDNLVLLGGAALPALLAMAGRHETQIVLTAVRIMGEIRDARALPALVSLLVTSRSVDVRAQAACALGKVGGQEAVDALLPALSDPAWEVRAQAAKAAGRIGDPAAVPALERALPDASWWVRVNCAEALGQLRETGGAALRRIAAGSDRYAAEQAAAVLERAPTRRLPPARPERRSRARTAQAATVDAPSTPGIVDLR
jgi:HEAT repeat protein